MGLNRRGAYKWDLTIFSDVRFSIQPRLPADTTLGNISAHGRIFTANTEDYSNIKGRPLKISIAQRIHGVTAPRLTSKVMKDIH